MKPRFTAVLAAPVAAGETPIVDHPMTETTRCCCTCRAIKPLRDYHGNSLDPLGRARNCKECACAKSKKWSAANHERVKATADRWRAANPDKVRANQSRVVERQKERLAAGDPVAVARAERRKAQRDAANAKPGRHLWKYKISLDEWRVLLAHQGGVCAACSSDVPGHAHGWHTDHDHGDGRVRGIVCGRCNFRLGAMDDSASGVRAIAATLLHYLATVDERMSVIRTAAALTRRTFRPSPVMTFGVSP